MKIMDKKLDSSTSLRMTKKNNESYFGDIKRQGWFDRFPLSRERQWDVDRQVIIFKQPVDTGFRRYGYNRWALPALQYF
jgi:hypothetical protein